MKITTIIGTRPQFGKVAATLNAARQMGQRGIEKCTLYGTAGSSIEKIVARMVWI